MSERERGREIKRLCLLVRASGRIPFSKIFSRQLEEWGLRGSHFTFFLRQGLRAPSQMRYVVVSVKLVEEVALFMPSAIFVSLWRMTRK